VRIEAAVIEEGCNLFSEREVEPDIRIRGMTIADAMEALRMHKNAVLGIGKRPGLPERAALPAEVVAALKKRLKSFAAWQDHEAGREGVAPSQGRG
jgi:hypothetical protein